MDLFSFYLQLFCTLAPEKQKAYPASRTGSEQAPLQDPGGVENWDALGLPGALNDYRHRTVPHESPM
jgi:hypothetical protein